MNIKENILNAWIMVELLSEGDINIKGKEFLKFDDVSGGNFFSFFKKLLSKNKNKKSGIAIYVDVFEFSDVVEFLRGKYGLSKPEEEIKYGSKFDFAIYFDKDLNFLSDLTFFTAGGFIRDKKDIPTIESFRAFESEQKIKLEQCFEYEEDCEDECNPQGENYAKRGVDPLKFNEQMVKALALINNDVNLDNCRIQIINNIEADVVNLHSFFVDDLEKAKKITTENLDRFLLGINNQRINLDSKNDSPNFNGKILEEILEPRNYPLGRFPSNTKYALSFMQQVAVNLSIGFDNNQMRSVNGPPGTGKTTLLKDIFAELVVKQAYDICNLSSKEIKGSKDTTYFDKASIGIVPANISKNNIVVASSNNGAVQNIVNELPLISGVSEALGDGLREIDYFCSVANSDVTSEWLEGKEIINITPRESLYWGLFSLEGGKSENMKNIITRLKAVLEYFSCGEYIDNPSIYEEFKNQYKDIEKYRNNIFRLSEDIKRLAYLRKKIKEYEDILKTVDSQKEILQKNREELIKDKEEVCRKINNDIENYNKNNEILRNIEKNKPGIWSAFFGDRRKKEEYNKKHAQIEKFLEENLASRKSLEKEQETLESDIRKNYEEIERIEIYKKKIDALEKAKLLELEKIQKNVDALNGRQLDLNKSYNELQLSNPWFTEEYRILQSKLFISALGVRKQFLYENKKNIKAAVIIWNKQNEYIEKKNVISAAWDWINLTIPVISSTFASFGKMCKHLEKNSLGHLFIDEAGQALPQASVGAIFRSKSVMVVGDPAQIKPVLTLDPKVLGILRTLFNVSEKYLSDFASTQTLVDAVSQYGYYRDYDKNDSSWIGIPLWVHRRCEYPMFTISNRISYKNMMVQGKPDYGRTGWYDIKGNAYDKYVKEQGEFLLNVIQGMIKKDPRIIDKDGKDIIYVISPFANVAFQLAETLDEIHFTRRDANGKPTNVGTVHTFQGKEAPIVFLVLGADKQSIGAASWAVSEPNIMNVAATRAKEEFYIVGDKELYLKQVSSDIARDTYEVIINYKEKYPDLVAEQENFIFLPKQVKQNISESNNEGVLVDINSKSKSRNTCVKKEPQYIGNRANKSFHTMDCKYAPKKPEKRVEFFSREEAVESGFTPCSNCGA